MSEWRELGERVREYILSSVVRNSIAEEAAALSALYALTAQMERTERELFGTGTALANADRKVASLTAQMEELERERDADCWAEAATNAACWRMAEQRVKELEAALAIAIEDVLLMDSPEADSPRNIASNLRAALARTEEQTPGEDFVWDLKQEC